MHIVKFKDGTYSIRKNTLFGYRYLPRYLNSWVNHRDQMFYSRYDTLEQVQFKLVKLIDYGKPICLKCGK